MTEKKTKKKTNNKTENEKIKDRSDAFVEKIFSVNKDKDDKISEAENVSLIIKEWLNPKHIKRKTRYTKRQVRAVTVLQSLADTYKIKTLDRYLTVFRTTKLSEDGKSSEELEAILKSRMPEIQENALEKMAKFLE